MSGVDVQQHPPRMHARHQSWPPTKSWPPHWYWHRELFRKGEKAATHPYVDMEYTHIPPILNQGLGNHQSQIPRSFPHFPLNSLQRRSDIYNISAAGTTIRQPVRESTSDSGPLQMWMSAQPEIGSLRELILTARIKVKSERESCYQQEDIVENIMDDILAHLDTASTQSSWEELRDNLGNLIFKMKVSREQTRVLRERTAGVENFLSQQEYQLSKLEQRVYHDLDRTLSYNKPFPIHHHHIDTQTTLSQEISATSELRDKLYSRMGEVRIYLERLHNFESDLRQELDERDILRATGQIEISDDAEFFEETRAERLRLEQDLEAAQADMIRLKNQCIQEGISFEEPELPNILFNTRAESFATASGGSKAEFQAPISSSGIIGAFFSAQDRVKRWLGDPPNRDKRDKDEIVDPNSRSESRSDYAWIPSLPSTRRPSLTRPHSADSAPQWNTGPLPGSRQLEALLLESASTPLGRFAETTQGQRYYLV